MFSKITPGSSSFEYLSVSSSFWPTIVPQFSDCHLLTSLSGTFDDGSLSDAINSLPPPGLTKLDVRINFGRQGSLVNCIHKLVLNHKLDNLMEIKIWCKKDEWKSEELVALVRDLRALNEKIGIKGIGFTL